MPHDHHYHFGHAQDHDHRHGRDHPNGQGHNHGPGDHLHSNLHAHDGAADLQVLTAQFVEGFVQAADKTAYLRLMGVPFEKAGSDGPTALKLVDVELRTDWQVGTASPSFGSRDLSYLPFPGQMVRERTNMGLVYVSTREKAVQDIREFLAGRG
jgi:hypothetical protein